jgi:Domain of unknown function (DUF4276)
MSLQRVLILVEGQTEEAFVKNALAPYLLIRQVHPIPKIVTTRRKAGSPHDKGGISTYGKVKTDLRLLLKDSNASLVTTLIDYYGLPSDFPGRQSSLSDSYLERAKQIEHAFSQDINHPRFLPYLSLHEFEALLFSEPETIAKSFSLQNQLAKLLQITSSVSTPEEINDDPLTAPSKRLRSLYPNYDKPLHGTTIALQIGIEKIRNSCPHFNEWLAKLESLNQSSS